MSRSLARRPRPERGAAAVEFALVVPLLLLLTFGIVTYGYMLSFRQAISQAAAEGARAAAISLATTGAGRSVVGAGAVNDALSSYGVSCVIPTGASSGSLVRRAADVGSCAMTSAPCGNNPAATCMSVRITYDYRRHPLVPAVPGTGLVTPDSLSYTAVARTS